MFLESLFLNNFKSFEEKELNFEGKVHCIIGTNGSGKTNLLDSIYYLALCKSYFSTPDASCITFGHDYFSLNGSFVRRGERHVISCAVTSDKKKTFKHDDKPYERLSEHIGLVPLIMIAPQDINLINGAGEERRRFFDTFISQLDGEYLRCIVAYSKLLADRNKLLKNSVGTVIDRDLISVLDERISFFGSLIYAKRADICMKISPLVQKLYASIAMGEIIDVTYESQLHRSDMLSLLGHTYERDRVMGFTSSGIHRDDFTLKMDGRSIRNFGSQGQKKTFLMALKFGQYLYTANALSLKPILILDDLFDKLDHGRVTQVVNIICSTDFGQIFISDTDRNNLSEIFGHGQASVIQL